MKIKHLFLIINILLSCLIATPIMFVYADETDHTSCFLAGTKVIMSDGSLKNIEDIKIGDKILSYNEKTKNNEIQKVLDLEQPIRDHYYEVKFEDGSILKVTDEHPMFTKNGWASINPLNSLIYDKFLTVKLNIANEILTKDGTWNKIINMQRFDGNVQTYNLKEISNTHTFYVEGLLTHNKDGGDSDSDSADKAGEDAESSVDNAANEPGVKAAAAKAGVDLGKLGNLANTAAKNAFGAAGHRAGFSATIDTPSGSVTATGLVDPTSPTGFSLSFSVTTKSGTAVSGSNMMGGFGSLGDALGAQEKANSEESSKSGFWSLLASIALGLIGLIAGPIGMVATAVSVGWSAVSLGYDVANGGTVGGWVEGKIDSWGRGLDFMTQKVSKSFASTQTAEKTSDSPKGVADKNKIDSIVANKNKPYQINPNGAIVKNKDSRDEGRPIYSSVSSPIPGTS